MKSNLLPMADWTPKMQTHVKSAFSINLDIVLVRPAQEGAIQ